MTDETKNELLAYREECEAKLREMPKRLAEERAAAQKEGRKPFPLFPVVEVTLLNLRAALEAVEGDPEGPIRETLTSWRGVVASHMSKDADGNDFGPNQNVRADQLLSVLHLAIGKSEKFEAVIKK